jgi:DNA-binding winged helix-turn-helix (wHTH) protein/Tol biopolymer transport system component
MVAIPPSLPDLPNLCFGPFELNPASGELRKSGILIKLQPQPFRLLLLLAERSGTVVTREEIQRCLWTESTFVDFEHGINFSINQIRTALADDADKPRFIETLPRRGYRFIAPVQISSNGHKATGIAAAISDPEPAPGLYTERPDRRQSHPHSVVYIRPDLEFPKIAPEPQPNTKAKQLAAAAAIVLLVASVTFWMVSPRPVPRGSAPELKLRQLTANPPESPVSNGAISPDGKYLAYTDPNGMHLKLIQTGETRLIPQPQSLNGKDVEWRILEQWFPDGTRFLADAHPSGQSPAFFSSEGSSIWIVSVLGGPPRKLRDDAISNSISPDGTTIAFGTNKGRLGEREIWLMGPNGEQARKLYETDENSAIGGLRWFPHGQRVWYRTADKSGSNFVTRELSGGPITSLLPPSEPHDLWDLALLPDGRLLYPVFDWEAVGITCNYWALPLDERTGGYKQNAKRLTNWGGTCPIDTSVTADGKKLAFLDWLGRTFMFVADIDERGTRYSNQRRFAPSEGSDTPLDWTRDSKQIIFSSNRDGHIAIFKQSLSGDAAELLVTVPNDDAEVRVSPDGAWVVYFVLLMKDSTASFQVMRIPVNGGIPQFVLTTRQYSEIRCARSPSTLCVISERTEDRKQIVFTAFDPLKGRGAEILRVNMHNEAQQFHWDLSPNGSRICYTRNPQQPIEIFSLLDRTTQTVHVKDWNNLESLGWTTDGTGFFIASGVHGGMALLRVDLQGNANVLQRSPGSAAAFARPSPDGRHLAIHNMGIEGNIWTLENF